MNFKFDREKIVSKFPYKPKDPDLQKKQEVALVELLTFIEGDSRWQCIEQVAYFLATIAHECTFRKKTVSGKMEMFHSMSPVREVGTGTYFNERYGKQTAVGKRLGNTEPFDGARFCGRGYMQLTGRHNYVNHALTGSKVYPEDLQNALPQAVNSYDKAHLQTRTTKQDSEPLYIKQDTFIIYPDLILIPRLSYLEAVSSMLKGRYTGRALGGYINQSKVDYLRARSVINNDVETNGAKIEEMAIAIEGLLRSGYSYSVTYETLNIEKPISEPVVETPTPALPPTPPTPPTIGHAPDVPPIEVLDLKSRSPQVVALLTAAAGALSGFLEDKPYLLIASVVIVLALIVGAFWLNYERLKIASDPTKYNVK